MRAMALWASGAALAFFLTAGAFLLLANLATGSSEQENLSPEAGPGKSGPALDLDLDEGQLASLQASPDQKLQLAVQNEGDRDFSDVNLTLKVASGNTALPETHYYRHTVRTLQTGETRNVEFIIDLSEPEDASTPPAVPSEPQKIIEIRATTPEGVSAVRTAIVPL